MTSRAVHVAQILWPAFIVAGILEMVVFAWVDPASLTYRGMEMDSKAVYTIAFFVFWALVSLAAELSHWMMKAGEFKPVSVGVNEPVSKAVRRHARRHRQSRSLA